MKVRFSSEGDAGISIIGADAEMTRNFETLKQAIIMRLLVQTGELTQLGHPEYGSRLNELIGHPLHEANLQLMKRFVKISLKHEKRIKKIETIKAYTSSNNPGAAFIDLSVIAQNGETGSIGVTVHV